MHPWGDITGGVVACGAQQQQAMILLPVVADPPTPTRNNTPLLTTQFHLARRQNQARPRSSA